jgi:hypothetical protein
MSWRLRWLLADIRDGLARLVCTLARGPVCACGDVELSEARALKRGWRWGTYYPGAPGWICNECWKNGQEPQQF